MTRVRVAGTVIATAVLAAGLGTTATAASGSVSTTATVAATRTAPTTVLAAKPKPAPPKPKPKPFNPSTGVKLNDPLGKGYPRYAGYGQVFKSIEWARYPSRIDIATWNFDSTRIVNALVAAHKRGVRVRLLMQDNMALHQSRSTGSFWRLKAGLSQPRNLPKREKAGTSWARYCQRSCRGHGGILHSKFYLFSKVAQTPNVVVNSSGNLTEFAATVQWNDTYTVANHAGVYNTYVQVFKEMARDERARHSYREIRHDATVTSIVFPYQGRNTPSDPVIRRLRGVACTGATNGAGDANGFTKIRIAQTAWMDDRGEAIAKRIKNLWDSGCNVRVIFAVMPQRIQKVLRSAGPRGAVPMRQITQDSDGDGFYDRYLHMKLLTIDGVKASTRDAHLVWNGSENWNAVSLRSDEAGFRIVGEALTHKYNRWIDYLFAHAPEEPGEPPPPPEEEDEGRRTLGRIGAAEAKAAINPYKFIEIN